MARAEFISYLKTLKPHDWQKMATDRWTVKDVVAHMVGWEKDDPDSIRAMWATKQPVWWMTTEDYDEFNRRAVEYYKKCTPEDLLAEWAMWQGKVAEEVERIGEANLRQYPKLFSWFLEDKYDSHYNHHLRQIKKAVEHN